MVKKPYRLIHLLSRRLELRPYRLSDFEILQKSHTERRTQVDKFDAPLPASQELSYAKHKERVKRYQTRGKEEQQFVFGIFERKTGDYIGQIDILVINKQIRWGNLGYHLQNQYFGQGYATEASVIAIRGAFKFLGFHRIEAAMELDNRASQRVAVKTGLRFEGKRLKFFPDKGGIDMNVYATNAIDFGK